MIGKNCVAIATDLRLGKSGRWCRYELREGEQDSRDHASVQQTLMASGLPVNDMLYDGLPGLATDVLTLSVSSCRTDPDSI